MNPSPKRHQVLVGVFVSIAVAILAGGVLMIGDLNDTFTRKLTVRSEFEEVGGLKRGDSIWFSGVKVGRVSNLSFNGASHVEVDLKIDMEVVPFISADSLTKIGSDGLIGNRIVVLYGGTPGGPSLQAGDVLKVGKSVSTEEVMTMLQDNNTNILAITTDLKGITGKLVAGEGTFGKLLQDDALHANLTETVTMLNMASSNARSLTASLSTFSAKLNQKGSLPDELVSDRTTYASLTGTVDSLQHAGERASNLMDGLAQGATDPKAPVGALMHDEQAGTDLKGTLDNLNRGSLLLAEDLEALQHNFLFRRFFRKKAKAEATARARSDLLVPEVSLSLEKSDEAQPVPGP